MNTIALPESFTKEDQVLLPPVGWDLYVEKEDGGFAHYHSCQGHSWSDLAEPTLVDDILLPMTREKVYRCYLTYPDGTHVVRLRPPESTPFFGFTRWAQPVTQGSPPSSPTWLYSAFGYLLADYCVLVKVYPSSYLRYDHILIPRPMTFPL